ncbi:flagellar biosynthesis protein FlhA [Herbaspirillum sp. RTI4]|uniref:flagellar biosynthesis protein FlhA n=1 Tax=Herbaspirillum sp. RTI4 TaxID=3048640 RepID=UPI002AB59876|nr:flagellar biosynthesis protein FlhA [Herbaspirillum sp. RTI4]MDY7577170.1 flagellar biosynthesis protein FlhA [Herbaspirillum sp. RTI4]MEA9980460.1 flagellar biosynthesis protein FlhA [Herbaspirillum sp. RTI4]
MPSVKLGPSRPRMNAAGYLSLMVNNFDVALGVFVAVVVTLFVLPMPTFMLDGMIVANLAASLTLLTLTLYVPRALDLATLPALLLLTTLFRLALNIASCKLILLNGEAGRVIQTFGHLVVADNVVVGGVVFTVIAIVQFVVIAKGAERVAEVGARFSLDAMPGKQMSIDADLRAGILSTDEARAKRRALEEESHLHGAMDGAMKFVKGDAIAGIIIALINILAGVAVGAITRGMSVSDALQHYAILTVGDGMASQIPSLLVSIAAGIIITRSAAPAGDTSNLGQQIGRELLSQPRALLAAGGVVLSFALIPGFPHWAFVLFGGSLLTCGLVLLRQPPRQPDATVLFESDLLRQSESGLLEPVCLIVEASRKTEFPAESLNSALLVAKQQVMQRLGPVFPRIGLSYRALPEGITYQLRVQDVVQAQGRLAAEPSPAHTDAIGAQVVQLIGEHAAAFIGIQEVQALVHRCQRDYPELAAEVSRVVPATRMAEVLQRLLREGIPIRDLKTIFDSLAVWAPVEQDIIMLTEFVRMDMKRYISAACTGADRTLAAIVLSPALEDLILHSIERTPHGNIARLDEETTQRIRDSIAGILAAPDNAHATVIVPAEIRRYVRKLLEGSTAETMVVSYQELESDVRLRTVGVVE